MSLTLTENAGPDLPKLEKGIYQGTCYRIVDLAQANKLTAKKPARKLGCALALKSPMR